jgi:hypothetical protein
MGESLRVGGCGIGRADDVLGRMSIAKTLLELVQADLERAQRLIRKVQPDPIDTQFRIASPEGVGITLTEKCQGACASVSARLRLHGVEAVARSGGHIACRLTFWSGVGPTIWRPAQGTLCEPLLSTCKDTWSFAAPQSPNRPSPRSECLLRADAVPICDGVGTIADTAARAVADHEAT